MTTPLDSMYGIALMILEPFMPRGAETARQVEARPRVPHGTVGQWAGSYQTAYGGSYRQTALGRQTAATLTGSASRAAEAGVQLTFDPTPTMAPSPPTPPARRIEVAAGGGRGATGTGADRRSGFRPSPVTGRTQPPSGGGFGMVP